MGTWVQVQKHFRLGKLNVGDMTVCTSTGAYVTVPYIDRLVLANACAGSVPLVGRFPVASCLTGE